MDAEIALKECGTIINLLKQWKKWQGLLRNYEKDYYVARNMFELKCIPWKRMVHRNLYIENSSVVQSVHFLALMWYIFE